MMKYLLRELTRRQFGWGFLKIVPLNESSTTLFWHNHWIVKKSAGEVISSEFINVQYWDTAAQSNEANYSAMLYLEEK